MLNASQPYGLSNGWSKHFWLSLAFLTLAVVALHAKTVPFNNELLYLLRLEPGFLPNDWSFSQAANEHWLFNSIFSLPARFLSIDLVAWTGRIACWLLCLAGMIRLGRVWSVPYWTIVVSIGTWLAFGQAVVNAEWIFGTFEAKTVAYVCLIFALGEFARGRTTGPSILLGLAFSFHPAVGLWAIPAAGLALLLSGQAVRDLIRVAVLTFIFSLPGIGPLMFEQSTADSATFADWEFIVTKHMPYHFDPFYFSQIGVAVLVVMFIAVVAALWKTKNEGLRFLLYFQMTIAAFFALGFLLRLAELYPVLRFMPMRLFPILTPLFFLFTAGFLLTRAPGPARRALVVAVAVLVVAPLHPLDRGINQLRETKDSWRTHDDELEGVLRWIAANTPQDALFISSPNTRKIWYFSRRAQIASYTYPRYDRLPEWRGRIASLTGNAEIVSRDLAPQIIEDSFDRLSAAQIGEIAHAYNANYLLSSSDYPFAIVYRTEKYKVYALPGTVRVGD